MRVPRIHWTRQEKAASLSAQLSLGSWVISPPIGEGMALRLIGAKPLFGLEQGYVY